MKNLLLTAGFPRAQNTLALAELAHRAGHTIGGIIVVSPYSLKRLKSQIRQHGRGVIIKSAKRILGMNELKGSGTFFQADPIGEFFQQNNIPNTTLKKWCKQHNVPYHTVSDLNTPQALAIIKNVKPDLVVYGGGGILGKGFLDAAKNKILNAHSGPLPQIRGMNTCEWSIMLDIPPAVTVHYINEGIDTGDVIEQIPITISPTDTINTLRAKCLIAGVEGLLNAISQTEIPKGTPIENPTAHRQCYTMAPVIRELLEKKLNSY